MGIMRVTCRRGAAAADRTLATACCDACQKPCEWLTCCLTGMLSAGGWGGSTEARRGSKADFGQEAKKRRAGQGSARQVRRRCIDFPGSPPAVLKPLKNLRDITLPAMLCATLLEPPASHCY
jgi:hypothetical protein